MLTVSVPEWARHVSDALFYAGVLVAAFILGGLGVAALALVRPDALAGVGSEDVADTWDTAAPHLDVSNIRRLEETIR